MRTLYLECRMGCAGDMLMGALSELVDQKAFIEKMNTIGLAGIRFEAQPSSKCGILGTHMRVVIDGKEEEALDANDHDATFFYGVSGLKAEEIHHLEHHLAGIEGMHDIHLSETELSYSYDHDHGADAETKVRAFFADHVPSAELHAHGHDHHEADHHAHHHGMHMTDIHDVLQSLNVSDRVREDAEAVYRLIAEAESKAHGMPVENIHFHEVGTMDAIADVVGNCVLFEMIGADRVLASPVALGNGMVRCAHGILPVPAPATAYILQGIPTYSGRMQGEMCTPTGAALLKHFVSSFESQPTMATSAIGYGMGKKDFEAANCVRAFLGDAEDDNEICELTCNIDDMTPEGIGYAYDVLFAAGALDVYVTPVHMKKNRPGYVFTCMCRISSKEKILQLMFRHLTTLGIRENTCRRHSLSRSMETCETSLGPVRNKKSTGFGVIREKLEFDDLKRIADEKGLSIEDVRKIVEKEIKK